MKIRIATEGRTITVDMEQGMAQKMFNDFAIQEQEGMV